MADVTLPQLGETVTEGTITQWFKQVGDSVAADEPLFEVSTDKVDTEVPSPAAGTLTEIRAEEGETVDVGVVIAVIGDSSDAPAGADGDAGGDASSDGEPAAEPEPQRQQQATEPEPEQAEPAPTGDEQPAADQGEATTPEAAVEEDAVSPDAGSGDAEQPTGEPTKEPVVDRAPAEQEPVQPSDGQVDGASASGNRLLSPVVRRLVRENDLDPSIISGTGPGGRITRDDVLDHLDKVGATAAAPPQTQQTSTEPAPAEAPADATPKDAAPAPAPAATAKTAPAGPQPAATPAAPAPSVRAGERDTSVPLSKIRRLTGAHMVMSRSVSPHAFSVVEVDFANVDLARVAVKNDWKQRQGFSLTYLPFICRAVIDVLDDFPHLNASVADNELVVHNFIDLGIAVDLDYEGLLVPVIRDAETKRLGAIAKEIHDLADRARNRKLGPDEITGGTFTISNNGSAGSVLTAAIISQPQVAILSTDAIVPKPVAAALPDGTYAVVVHPVGNLAMSWDHRAFDGAYAAGFLKRVKELLEAKDWSGEL